MFKLTDKDLVVTRFFNKSKWFGIFSKYLTADQREFLQKHWFSIDAVKVSFKEGKEVNLYEIKTKNKYNNPRSFWRTKFTQSTVDVYTQALKRGFKVTVATVWLLDNWNYEIEMADFRNADYCVDRPKQYDLGNSAGALRK